MRKEKVRGAGGSRGVRGREGMNEREAESREGVGGRL